LIELISKLKGIQALHWQSPIAIIAGVISLISFEYLTFLQGKEGFTQASVAISTSLGLVFIWAYYRRPAVTPKNKLGFVVSIACAGEKEYLRVKDDFIFPLRKLIKSGNAGQEICFAEISQYHANKIIDSTDAQLLRINSKAHFLLYGRVRLRNLNGIEHYFLELDGIVAHTHIPKIVSKVFAEEFRELLPQNVQISTENDLLEFQFTSESVDLVSKYIIGIASYLSGDLAYAESLYGDCHSLLTRNQDKFEIYSKLRGRLPLRIAEINRARATASHRRWIETQDPDDIEKVGVFLSKIENKYFEQFDLYQLAAIFEFAANRDIEKAIKLLRNSNLKNSAWNFSLAFLYGYKGDLKTAIRHYRRTQQIDVEIDVINQVEDFLCWSIEEEPDKYHLNYLLGYFYMGVKQDNILALERFKRFLSAEGCSNSFNKESSLSAKWIKKLEQ